ncbi:hypothetical protein HZA56_14350 [Candidatus Poribacteria bacterium]|nr:hypothetical protein [Candidatus Poribacteria bacterium]
MMPKTKVAEEGMGGGNSRSKIKIIEALIVVGTFALILVLSIVTKGESGKPASGTVVAVRIALFSVVAGVYYWMLYRTGGGGSVKKETPETRK